MRWASSASLLTLLSAIHLSQQKSAIYDFKTIFHTPDTRYDDHEILERANFGTEEEVTDAKNDGSKAVANAQVLLHFNEKPAAQPCPHSNYQIYYDPRTHYMMMPPPPPPPLPPLPPILPPPPAAIQQHQQTYPYYMRPPPYGHYQTGYHSYLFPYPPYYPQQPPVIPQPTATSSPKPPCISEPTVSPRLIKEIITPEDTTVSITSNPTRTDDYPSSTTIYSTEMPETTTYDEPITTEIFENDAPTDVPTTSIYTPTEIETTTTEIIVTTSNIPTTESAAAITDERTTTELYTTTEIGTTESEFTDVPTTTDDILITTEEIITPEALTTTEAQITTESLSTTESLTTTESPTTESVTTTEAQTTTETLSTTESLTTTESPTTESVTTTEAQTTTDSLSTTESVISTEAQTTTESVTTTETQTTTESSSTTESETTTGAQTTTESLSTTESPTTTDTPTTTTELFTSTTETLPSDPFEKPTTEVSTEAIINSFQECTIITDLANAPANMTKFIGKTGVFLDKNWKCYIYKPCEMQAETVTETSTTDDPNYSVEVYNCPHEDPLSVYITSNKGDDVIPTDKLAELFEEEVEGSNFNLFVSEDFLNSSNTEKPRAIIDENVNAPRIYFYRGNEKKTLEELKEGGVQEISDADIEKITELVEKLEPEKKSCRDIVVHKISRRSGPCEICEELKRKGKSDEEIFRAILEACKSKIVAAPTSKPETATTEAKIKPKPKTSPKPFPTYGGCLTCNGNPDGFTADVDDLNIYKSPAPRYYEMLVPPPQQTPIEYYYQPQQQQQLHTNIYDMLTPNNGYYFAPSPRKQFNYPQFQLSGNYPSNGRACPNCAPYRGELNF